MQKNFYQLLSEEKPLQIVGTINAYTALLAEKTGFRALYVSGAGISNASLGVPDIGLVTLNDLCEETRRINSVVNLPILVDMDVGGGTNQMIGRTIKSLIQAGAAGAHIEDQSINRKCGHLSNKKIISISEMQDRIKSAVDARTDEKFTIMARTDAYASEGLGKTLERICAYIEAGADMIFPESLPKLEDFSYLTKEVSVPLLANMTEFGKTPYYTLADFAKIGVSMVLYPLSAFRAMSKAALKIFEVIRKEGSQKDVLQHMETREELYKNLSYEPDKLSE